MKFGFVGAAGARRLAKRGSFAAPRLQRAGRTARRDPDVPFRGEGLIRSVQTIQFFKNQGVLFSACTS